MKKKIFLFFLIIFLFASSSLLFSQEKKLRVKAESANIYADPDIFSAIVEKVERGTILSQRSASKVRNIWYFVSFYSKKKSTTVFGFVQASLVEMIVEGPKIIEKEEKKPSVAPVKPPEAYPIGKIKMGGKYGIGGVIGYASPSDKKYNSTLEYGGNICLAMTENISIELSGLAFQTDGQGDPEALSKGRLSIIPIQISLQARYPISARFVPYLLGGGGYYLFRFNLDKDISDALDALGFDIKEKVKNAPGYHFGGGIDFFFTRKIALNFDVKYYAIKTKGSWALTDQISGTVTSGDLENLKFNSLLLAAGLKFYF